MCFCLELLFVESIFRAAIVCLVRTFLWPSELRWECQVFFILQFRALPFCKDLCSNPDHKCCQHVLTKDIQHMSRINMWRAYCPILFIIVVNAYFVRVRDGSCPCTSIRRTVSSPKLVMGSVLNWELRVEQFCVLVRAKRRYWSKTHGVTFQGTVIKNVHAVRVSYALAVVSGWRS